VDESLRPSDASLNRQSERARRLSGDRDVATNVRGCRPTGRQRCESSTSSLRGRIGSSQLKACHPKGKVNPRLSLYRDRLERKGAVRAADEDVCSKPSAKRRLA
jgi:hypothetical protein